MTWQTTSYFADWLMTPRRPLIGSFTVNEKCFIRKQHQCGKVTGASKSCFIACPTQDDLEPILELMSEKLSRAGIEAIVAVKDRAYGQDIFCTKICGKIIESRFCIVILDDAIVKTMNIPNPNVYYEYGLMTALRKHIIPLQKEDLKLAFNIQSYDTIKYSSKNVAVELDRAIKDAIKLTESQEKEDEHSLLTDKVIMRRLELAGFTAKDNKWFLHDAIGDTNFRGFGHNEKRLYLYLGRIDSETDTQNYIDDLGVVLYRTEQKRRDLISNKEDYKRRIEAATAEGGPSPTGTPLNRRSVAGSYFERTVREYTDQIADIDSKLSTMSRIVVALIVIPDIDLTAISKRIEYMIGENAQYEIAVGTRDEITVDGTKIRFTSPSH